MTVSETAEPQLTQEQLSLLSLLKKNQWYYTIGRFPEPQELADMGFLETMPNPCGFNFPAYRLKKEVTHNG